MRRHRRRAEDSDREADDWLNERGNANGSGSIRSWLSDLAGTLQSVEQSWAQGAIQWLLTPALVAGALLGLVRLFDPPTRWSRRLRSDLSIASGLPSGPEKSLWEESVTSQAQRIREYRIAFTGWAFVQKWAAVVFFGGAIIGLVLYPPISQPDGPVIYGPGDYALMLPGLVACLLYVGAVAAGTDFLGRSPREIILRRRLGRYNNRRWKKLMMLEKERERRRDEEPTIRPKGTRLGFRAQVDDFGPFMRDSDLRSWVRTAGFVGADFHAQYQANLKRRGVAIPPWPAHSRTDGSSGDGTYANSSAPPDVRTFDP